MNLFAGKTNDECMLFACHLFSENNVAVRAIGAKFAQLSHFARVAGAYNHGKQFQRSIK